MHSGSVLCQELSKVPNFCKKKNGKNTEIDKKKMCPEKPGTSILFMGMTVYSPNFLRISLGMAFLLMRKSMVLAAMKDLVMYQMPL